MIVVILTACPAGLRGHLTRWLLEISPGVFIGVVSARVRELLWERVVELCRDGRAIMVHTAKNEQRLDFKVHRHDWEPIDLDGIRLMLRKPLGEAGSNTGGRPGWSKASRYQKARAARASQPQSE